MISSSSPALANVAEHLRDDEIHVWQLDYRPQWQRAPLHSVLGAYLGVGADRVALVDGAHGRPTLAPDLDPSLGFNWSHSGDHALIAIGRGVLPGIDIETLRPRPRALEIAERYFSPDEVAALAALPADARHAAFLEIWTAKEAVLKALGRGLAFGLDRLSISRGADGMGLQRLEGNDVRDWQLQPLALGPAMVAALAWRGEPRRLQVGRLASDG